MEQDSLRMENFRLRGEMMRVAAEIVSGEEALLHRYIIAREEIEGFSIPIQNELVPEQIETLRHILSTRKRRAPEPASRAGDTGGSAVTSTGKRNDHATALVKCSTSYSAGPDERPLSGKTTPHLGATKQSKQTSVGSLNDSKILEILLRTPLSAVFVRAHQRIATNSWQMNSTALAIATNAGIGIGMPN
jgi:hypothetical protein